VANATPCQTPGAQFTTHINKIGALVNVAFGRTIDLTEDEAALLETNLHNAVELVLAPLWARTALCGKHTGTGTCTRIPGHKGGCAITSSHLPEHTAATRRAAERIEKNWIGHLNV
jgi:hypothetical protein